MASLPGLTWIRSKCVFWKLFLNGILNFSPWLALHLVPRQRWHPQCLPCRNFRLPSTSWRDMCGCQPDMCSFSWFGWSLNSFYDHFFISATWWISLVVSLCLQHCRSKSEFMCKVMIFLSRRSERLWKGLSIQCSTSLISRDAHTTARRRRRRRLILYFGTSIRVRWIAPLYRTVLLCREMAGPWKRKKEGFAYLPVVQIAYNSCSFPHPLLSPSFPPLQFVGCTWLVAFLHASHRGEGCLLHYTGPSIE